MARTGNRGVLKGWEAAVAPSRHPGGSWGFPVPRDPRPCGCDGCDTSSAQESRQGRRACKPPCSEGWAGLAKKKPLLIFATSFPCFGSPCGCINHKKERQEEEREWGRGWRLLLSADARLKRLGNNSIGWVYLVQLQHKWKKNLDKAPVLQHQGLTFTCSAAPVASRCFRFPGFGSQIGNFSRQSDLSVEDIAHSWTCINNAKVINNNSVPALSNARERNCFTGVSLMPFGKDLYLLSVSERKDGVVLKQGMDVTQFWDFGASLAIFRIDLRNLLLESCETNIDSALILCLVLISCVCSQKFDTMNTKGWESQEGKR